MVTIDSGIRLQYIPDTLKFITNHSPQGGFLVSDDNFRLVRPALLGQQGLDGYYPVGKIDGKGSGGGYALFDVLVIQS